MLQKYEILCIYRTHFPPGSIVLLASGVNAPECDIFHNPGMIKYSNKDLTFTKFTCIFTTYNKFQDINKTVH